jgi:ABC-2 type transport system permease protein/lipopolysaccharide transport system permease protein
MSLLTPSEGSAPSGAGSIGVSGVSQGGSVPPEPPSDLIYRHHTKLSSSLRDLWASRDIIFTLAERDIRAQYKQSTLGILWALIFPLAMLGIFTIIFSKVKSQGIPGVPYPLYAYTGILYWTFFAGAFGQGGMSLLTNNAILSKTQFPRECFPLECVVVTAVNSALAVLPMGLLLAIFHFTPHPQIWVWLPAFILIQVGFTIGMVVMVSALIVQMRDLVQVVPIVLMLGLFATPVIWQFKRIPHNLQIVYGFFSPMGPMIDDTRRAMLLGLNPVPGPFIAAVAGTIFYLLVGYRVFKRLEVNFADIA